MRKLTALLFILITLFIPYISKAETMQSVKLKDGNIIYGTIIQMSADKITVLTKDNETITKNFEDVQELSKDDQENIKNNAVVSGLLQNANFYIAIIGGASFPMDIPSNLTVAGVGYLNGDIELKTGWLAGAKFGYLIPSTNRIIAVELEYNHIANDTDADHIYPLGETISGHSKIDALMFNMLARLPSGIFHPYIGAGAGYANVAIDDALLSLGDQTANISSVSTGVFAYQLLTGIDFDITNNWFISLGYKYFAASKASYNTSATSPSVPGSKSASLDAEYKSSAITFSVGYLF